MAELDDILNSLPENKSANDILNDLPMNPDNKPTNSSMPDIFGKYILSPENPFTGHVIRGIGTAIKGLNDTIVEMGRPSYKSPKEWKEEQTGLSKAISNTGESIQQHYDDNFGKGYEPYSVDWYASNIGEMLPTSVGLGAAGLAALRNGNPQVINQGAADIAARLGAGAKAAKWIGEGAGAGYVGTIGAYPEAALEGNDAFNEEYEAAKKEGLSDADATVRANKAKNFTTAANMFMLGGTNTAELLAGVGKLPFEVPKSGAKRLLMNAGRVGAAAEIEGQQEGAQEIIQSLAQNKPWSYNDENVVQARSLGRVAGGLFGAAGRIGDAIESRANNNVNEVLNSLPENRPSDNSNTNNSNSHSNDFNTQLKTFKAAITDIESGGDYDAIGPEIDGDRARGKYQIMESNWPSWAENAGLPADAPMTPENQERVVDAKMKEYYNEFGGDWGKVAIAWHAGPGRADLMDEQLANLSDGNMSTLDYRNSVLSKMGNISPGNSTALTNNLSREKQQKIQDWVDDRLAQSDDISEINFLEDNKKDLPGLIEIGQRYKLLDEGDAQQSNDPPTDNSKAGIIGRQTPVAQVAEAEDLQNLQQFPEQEEKQIITPGKPLSQAMADDYAANMQIPTRKDYHQEIANIVNAVAAGKFDAAERELHSLRNNRQGLVNALNAVNTQKFDTAENTIKENIRKDQYDKLDDLERLFIDALEFHKAPLDSVESELQREYNKRLDDYANILRGQMKQGTEKIVHENASGDKFTRNTSMNYQWYRDMLKRNGGQMPNKANLGYELQQIAGNHLKNGYVDPTYGPQVPEAEMESFRDLEAAVNGIQQTKGKIRPAVREELRASQPGSTGGNQNIQQAARDAIPIAKGFGEQPEPITPIASNVSVDQQPLTPVQQKQVEGALKSPTLKKLHEKAKTDTKAKEHFEKLPEHVRKAIEQRDQQESGNSVENRVESKQEELQNTPRPVETQTSESTQETHYANSVSKLGDWVHEQLAKGNKFGSATLFKEADKAFVGTQAQGKYNAKDAYDALEMGINKFILNHKSLNPATADSVEDARKAIELIKREILSQIPTQTKRTAEQEEFQQFSTPPHIAYVAAWVANTDKNDTVLEPSAGIGGLAAFAKLTGAKVFVNELSERRAAIVKQLPFDRVFTENAEQIDNILPADVKPTAVIMNPPFSSTAGRMQGQRKTMNATAHIEQALKRLEPNGRLVAIVGRGMADNAASFQSWWKKIKSEYNVRANIGIDGKDYTKYGTGFDIQIFVIDKTGKTQNPTITGNVASAEEALPILEAIRDGRTATRDRFDEQTSDQSTSEAVSQEGGRVPGPVRGPVPVSTDNMGNRERGSSDRRQAGVKGVNPGNGSETSKRYSDNSNEISVESGRNQSSESSNKQSKGTENAGGRSMVSDGSIADSNRRTHGRSTIAIEATVNQAEAELSDSTFDNYQPQRLKVAGAKKHPSPLVQSAAMAAVEPPAPTYTPNLPKEVIEKGKMSIAQIEPVVYAGQSFEQTLPSGSRKGYFIGDGTGVGKGREISGIIMDSLRSGKKKAIWVSKNDPLFDDAIRDWTDLGGNKEDLLLMSKIKLGDPIPEKKNGIVFTTYNTLGSNLDVGSNGNIQVKPGKKARLDQLVEWVGKDFDGVIAFDEAHMMANSTTQEGTRGKKKPSVRGLVGVELQKQLPNARVVYVSATGATEVENLAYASRLGLWGEGTPFANVNDFISEIKSSGIAAMELVARDMKALGVYIARNLSFDGVSYGTLTHELTPEQREIYDTMAQGWQTVLQNIYRALKETGAVDEQGKTLNPQVKSSAMSAFWGAQQRFFNQILTSMQMPAVIDDVKKQIKAGNSVVMQLVNTNEATQNRQIANMPKDQALEELDLTPRDMLMQYLDKSFPTEQYEEYLDDEGNKRSRMVVDSQGKPVQNREAVAMKEQLMSKLGAMKVPDGPLEMIINTFGTKAVAEVTGRQRRVVKEHNKDTGRVEARIEARSKAHNKADVRAFLDDKKSILIFSDAGGTGQSFHAGANMKNQRRRIHYLIQPGWRADSAVQGFGRTHRSGEVSQPHYTLVTTDLRGQKRFISTIARRLDQLGALTKGQRDAANQGLFSAKDNLESQYARDALQRFYENLMHNVYTDLNSSDLLKKMGMEAMENEDRQSAKRNVNQELMRDVPKFLNRLLTLEYEEQNKVFDYFSAIMDDIIDRHIAQGTLDTGMENYRALSVGVKDEKTVYSDPKSGAETKYVELEAKHKNELIPWRLVERMPNFVGIYKNSRSGKVWAVRKGITRTTEQGRVVDTYFLQSPSKNRYQTVDESEFNREGWEKIGVDSKATQEAWEEVVKGEPEFKTEKLHMITGAILPIWDRLPHGTARVLRVQTDDNRRFLGRVIKEREVDQTLKRLDTKREHNYSVSEIKDKLLNENYEVELSNGWRLAKRRVSNENRIEIIGDDLWKYNSQFLDHDIFSERIQWKTRYFIPTAEKFDAAYNWLIKDRPVTEVIPPANPNIKYSAGKNTPHDTAIEHALHIRFIPESKLKTNEMALSELGIQLGVPVRFFIGSRGKRGFHVDGITYINRNGDRGTEWAFWHESLHWIKQQDPALYQDLYNAVNNTFAATPEQITAYRTTIEQGELKGKNGEYLLNDDDIIEEMFGDEMADIAKRQQWFNRLAQQNKGLFDRFVSYLKKMLANIKAMVSGTGQYSGFNPNQVKVIENSLRHVLLSLKDASGQRVMQNKTEFPYRELQAQYSSGNTQNQIQKNIASGMEAMEKVIREHTDVVNAMYRPEVGGVSFYWGTPGKGKKFKSGSGVSHIIAKRNFEGKNGEDIARKLVEVIAHGKVGEVYGPPKWERVNVSHDGHTAVLSLYKDGNLQTWLLTGWENNKEGSDVLGEGYDSSETTHADPSLTRTSMGAESSIKGSIPESNQSFQRDQKDVKKGTIKYSADSEASKSLSRQDIKRAIEELGAPLRWGRISDPSVRSIYKDIIQVVRTKRAFDWDAINNAVGKLLYKKLNLTKKGYEANEVADFTEVFFNDPVSANSHYPDLFNDFVNSLSTNADLANDVNEIRNLYDRWHRQDAWERAIGSISWGDEKKELSWGALKENVNKAWKSIYRNWFEEYQPVAEMVEKIEKNLGVKLSDAANPYVQARLARGWEGKARALLEGNEHTAKGLQEVYKTIDFRDFKSIQHILEEVGALKDKEVMKRFSAYCTVVHSFDVMSRQLKEHLRNKVSDTAWYNQVKFDYEQNNEADPGETDKTSSKKPKKEKVVDWLVDTWRAGEWNSEAWGKLPAFKTAFSEKDCREIMDTAPEQLKKAQRDIVKFSNTLLSIMADSGVISYKTYNIWRKKWPNYVPLFREFEDSAVNNLGNSLNEMVGSTRDIINPVESIIANTFKFMKRAEHNRFKQKVAMLGKFEAAGKLVEEVDAGGATAKESVFRVTFAGEPKYFQTTPEMYRAINAMDEEHGNLFLKILGYPAKILRAGATMFSPDFIVKNPLRDSIEAGIYARHGFLPIIDFIRGLAHVINKDSLYWEFLSSGAAQSNLVSMDRNYMRNCVKKMVESDKKYNFNVFEWLRSLSEFMENATRVGAYEKAKKSGAKMEEAAIEGRDVVIDFGRHGTASVAANQVIAFFNAQLQGYDKFFRALKDPKERARMTAMSLIYITLPTLLLWWLNKDDERYKETQQWEKDSFWFIPIGNTLFRLPKPFPPLGFIFGSFPERFLNWAVNHDKNAFNVDGWGLAKTTALSFLPTALLPIVELVTNKSLFTGKAIIPQSQEKLPAKMQYDPTTSSIAKKTGEILDLSPKQIEHFIRGYTAGLGSTGLWMVDAATGHKNLSDPGNIPGVRALVAKSYLHPQSVSEFFDRYKEMDGLYQEYRMTGEKPKGFDGAEYGRLRQGKKALDDLYEAQGKIQKSKMPEEEKNKRIEKITQRAAEISRTVLQKK
ncbi:hypothetical protein SOV_22990 [Sporomusa ovata DSM 2662]|uniref:DNA primase n=1 Tax=Sporomusa ovata TaxID=2378 RepID=A0A0U1L3A3_9FIRM|nr:strawberry notch family protein [Sporomusa ovata]EQB25615.1 putative methylase/helicase [Sporomusa ovata DSM 2662]CQR74172.1 DNA primase [Sporomusa ovata]